MTEDQFRAADVIVGLVGDKRKRFQPVEHFAEHGVGNGRVYVINFQADDGVGGVCTGSVTVCVPHDRGQGSNCIDDGQLYNWLGP